MTLDEMITANTHGEYESVGEWNIEHQVLDRDGLKQAIREAIERARPGFPADEYLTEYGKWQKKAVDGYHANLLRELGLKSDK